MKLFNSLSRQVEEFVPLKPRKTGMYTCGMTVYYYAHIGHGRKYVMDDLLRRLLGYNGYEVTHVQNVTDVGHLTSDADEGEDKMEVGAAKAGMTVWDVAKMFTIDFYESMDKLNILRPTVVCKATEHIAEQVELIKRLRDRGFAYETEEAVYFDVGKFPRYEGLFGNQELAARQVAVREDVQTGEHKKNVRDFALWFKAVGRFANHQMLWDSPWGRGFPGWHIECSAMAMKYLGDSFDIHTGGLEHQGVHHPNEIAQAEAATGKPFAKYWVHSGFLTVDGQKMSKSIGNIYRILDIVEKGFSPLALRYLYLTAHYRSPLNFTWSSMAAAQAAWDKLNQFVKQCSLLSTQGSRVQLSKEKAKKLDSYRQRFDEAVNDDMQFPRGLAVVWEMLKSNIPDYDKADALLDWDRVLGLKLGQGEEIVVPPEIKDMVENRNQLRRAGKFVQADQVRVELEKLGWKVEDSIMGAKIKKLIETSQ